MRILVVEDEKKVAGFIKQGLEEEGYAIDVAFDGREGVLMALDGVHDLIILDINLPKLDGLAVLQQFRQNHGTTPVLLLTVRAAIEDKVLGLDTGADDYLTKPFSFQELLAGSWPCSDGEWKPRRRCSRWQTSPWIRRAGLYPGALRE